MFFFLSEILFTKFVFFAVCRRMINRSAHGAKIPNGFSFKSVFQVIFSRGIEKLRIGQVLSF